MRERLHFAFLLPKTEINSLVLIDRSEKRTICALIRSTNIGEITVEHL